MEKKEIKSLAAYNLARTIDHFAQNVIFENGKYYLDVSDYTAADNFPTANWAANSKSTYRRYLGNSEKEAIDCLINHFFKYNYNF